MNFPPLLLIPLLLLRGECAGQSAASGANEVEPVITAMRAEISARPSRVLIAVEDALTMNEQAACEIIKEAIHSTRADAKLTGDIVFTALNHAPSMSASIIECSSAAAPGAMPEIESAVRKAFGEKALREKTSNLTSGDSEESDSSGEAAPGGKVVAGSGKEPAKSSGSSEGDGFWWDEDFTPGVGVGGIYLVMPRNASYMPCDPKDPCCGSDLSRACLVP